MDDFLLHGYFRVESVFPQAVAAECREFIWENLKKSEKIDRFDRTTWTKKHAIAETYSFEEPPWKNVFTQKFDDTINLLIGPNMFDTFGCGWWMLTFPGFEEENTSWRADGNWHIDGYVHRHYPHSKDIGLIPIIFFSDVLSDGGGTAVADGSHLVASKVLTEAGLKGMSSKELASAVLGTNISFDVVELTGKAGDVIFMHPLLLHARSTNLAPVEDINVRIMCHPSIPLKSHLNFNQSFTSLSLLEKSFVCGAISIFTNYSLNQHDVEIISNIHNQFIADQRNMITNKPTDDIITKRSSNCESDLEQQVPHLYEFINHTLRILKNINPDTCLRFQNKKLKKKSKRKFTSQYDDDNNDSDDSDLS